MEFVNSILNFCVHCVVMFKNYTNLFEHSNLSHIVTNMFLYLESKRFINIIFCKPGDIYNDDIVVNIVVSFIFIFSTASLIILKLNYVYFNLLFQLATMKEEFTYVLYDVYYICYTVIMISNPHPKETTLITEIY